MDCPKMSISLIKGSDTYPDVHLLTFDGFVIPFHRLVFILKGLQGCKLKTFLDDQFRDSKVPIRVEFDGQTVWRVISFIYDGTYQDEDEDLNFPKIEPPASPASANRLSAAPAEHQDVALVQGFRNLYITAQSCTSTALLKALVNVKVYQAAGAWDIDRLMVEAAQRFGEYVSGAFDRDDFPKFVEAVFNSVTGPAELLYDYLVKECFTHCQHLASNTNFLTVLEHNGKLAVRLYRELAKFQASYNDGTSTMLSPVPSALGAGSSTSASSSSAAALLEGQLAETRNAVSAKEEQIRTLEQEVAHLKQSIQEKISLTDHDARIAKLSADKDAVIDKLELQLDQKEENDEKVTDLKRALDDANKRNAQLVHQINSQRAGQPDNTTFLLERNEALENAKKLQSRLTASEDKVKKLEAQLAPHAQQPIIVNTAFVPQPSTNGTASRPRASQPTQTSEAAAPKRPIYGYGSMTASVNSIAAGSASAAASALPATPASPTPSARLILAPAAQNLNSNGPASFFEKLQRSRAAGIHGGENQSTTSSQAPPRMPVSVRGESTVVQQPMRSPSVTSSFSSTVTASALPPANGAPRGPHAALGRHAVGPHSPQVNGGAHISSTTPSVTTSSHINGTSQHATPGVNGNTVTPSVASASAHAAGPTGTSSAAPVGAPHTALSAAPVTPVATFTAIPNGQGNNSPDERDRTIAQLRVSRDFYRTQLNDLRFGRGGPNPPNPPNPPNQGPSNGNARLKGVLKALREYDLDHKACNDCSINFNAQWRGMVDDINAPDLILMCTKCGNEKCRWQC
ncbi:hypothetical protein KCU78_g2981, partial [Aureobasidium melanogenum]